MPKPDDMGEPWTPCPNDAICRNCPHPMAAHWRRNPRCGECEGCPGWSCRHGGPVLRDAVYAR